MYQHILPVLLHSELLSDWLRGFRPLFHEPINRLCSYSQHSSSQGPPEPICIATHLACFCTRSCYLIGWEVSNHYLMNQSIDYYHIYHCSFVLATLITDLPPNTFDINLNWGQHLLSVIWLSEMFRTIIS